MSDDLGRLSVFVAVAEERGFRAAGRRLGVSGSAVSQSIGQLEERLGVALFERTTRSVRLTEAGKRLLATAAPALADLRATEEALRELGDEPAGALRLNLSRGAESVVSGPLLTRFLQAHPGIELEIVVTEHTGEIVAAGYDAAVGLREMAERDMEAVPVSETERLVVVGAPAYFERHPPPAHPRDLDGHVCVNWRPMGGEPYRWEFTEGGTEFSVAVEARVVTTDPALNIDLAVAGLGLTITYERAVRPHLEAGDLVTVLEEYCPPFPGFCLYFPRRRHRSATLQALIDFVREARQQ